MKNSKIILFLLIGSLISILTIVFILGLEAQTLTRTIVTPNDSQSDFIDSAYDLSNYNSTSYDDENLKQRFDKLCKTYSSDSKHSKEYYYNGYKIDPYWKRHCIISIRRIMVISSKIDIIKNVVNSTLSNNDGAKKEFNALIEKDAYHEKLMDMSNYYAQFISNEIYKEIKTSLD